MRWFKLDTVYIASQNKDIEIEINTREFTRKFGELVDYEELIKNPKTRPIIAKVQQLFRTIDEL